MDSYQAPPPEFGPAEATLGACLRWAGAIGDVAEALTATDFPTDAQRKMWEAIAALWSRGVPVDLVTVSDELFRRGWADDVGYPYLAAVHDYAPTAFAASHYARLVRDKAIARDIRHAGMELQALGQNATGTGDELLDEAERLVFGVADGRLSSGAVSLDRALAEESDEFDARCLRYGRGQDDDDPITGLFDLDQMLGRFSPGGLTLLCARPSVGKSALALCVARNVAQRQGMGVFFASLEMSRLELAERLLCVEAGVDGQRVQRGCCSRDEKGRLSDAKDSLRGLPLHIDDTPRQTPLRLLAAARRLKLRHGIKLVIVDYLQLVESGEPKLPRHEQVASIGRRLKLLAREVGVHVLALAQLNRQVENRADSRPRLADIRESGTLEQDADKVVFLHAADNQPEVIEAIIAKHRNGPKGDVLLSYAREYTRFGDYSPAAAETVHGR